MIIEQPTLDLLTFEAWNEDAEAWEAWTQHVNTLSIQRGGKRNGVQVSVDPGLMAVTLVNAGDPLEDDRLKPNTKVRLTAEGEAIYTGRVSDISMTHTLDKQRNVSVTRVSILATDAVAAHAATTRYGAISDPETWAQRITRLAASALTEVELPPDDSPIVRYAI